jgi:hypothetical protein
MPRILSCRWSSVTSSCNQGMRAVGLALACTSSTTQRPRTRGPEGSATMFDIDTGEEVHLAHLECSNRFFVAGRCLYASLRQKYTFEQEGYARRVIIGPTIATTDTHQRKRITAIKIRSRWPTNISIFCVRRPV